MPPKPFRVAYTYSVIAVTLFLMAFMWLILWSPISIVRSAITSSMAQYDVENSTYGTFELADTFMNNVWTFILVIVLVGLVMWVSVYSQRKGEVMVVR